MVYNTGSIQFNNNTVNNCFLTEGIFRIDNSNMNTRNITISNSTFSNNIAEYGTVLNVQALKSFLINYEVIIQNSVFENNTALTYGGVIYSNSVSTNNNIHIYNCDFINNHATHGNDVYSLNIDSEPNISNINELRNIKGSVGTNPTNLILNDPSIMIQNLLSGEKIQEGIFCSIYDDYGNKIIFKSDISNVEFNEFMFFNLEINDTYNAVLVGQTNSYCWEDKCTFPPVKVVGNPGIYNLRLKINTFGQFLLFDKNYVDILVNIKECNTSYLSQDIENTKLKSW
ncbi:hypothetical protein PIROE2DRAFT_7805 [Piromyces sp. E2]|nr:hypothetical protein PIROE2DRAFT_7805 [Piromyces sp. E2]|eukprot:OUM65258.1 hypothetical protein PIROE2DRAFT_7805 [Piromyces sp. E2]